MEPHPGLEIAASAEPVSSLEYLSEPTTACGLETTETDGPHPSVSPSDLPPSVDELPAWAGCLMPTGYREALAVALLAPFGRNVGLMALLSGSKESPSEGTRRRRGGLGSVLARGVNSLRSVLSAARMVRGGTAGAVLCADGTTHPLPGLDGSELLADDSPVLATARDRIGSGQVYASFLWPLGGRHAPDGHARVTALAVPDDVPDILTAVVVLSPATDLYGLTPRELEVLGLLVEGCSNQEVARTLVVAPRTVAAHLEHILVKLEAPTRTLAAVRADRKGLYVPASCGHAYSAEGM